MQSDDTGRAPGQGLEQYCQVHEATLFSRGSTRNFVFQLMLARVGKGATTREGKMHLRLLLCMGGREARHIAGSLDCVIAACLERGVDAPTFLGKFRLVLITTTE
jgi:hypothetical protein